MYVTHNCRKKNIAASPPYINNPLAIFGTHNAQQAYIFPKLKNESLLSVGQLCDNDCTAIFDDGKVHIYKNEDVIITPTQLPLLRGNCHFRDGLWDIPLSQQENHHANYIICQDKMKTE